MYKINFMQTEMLLACLMNMKESTAYNLIGHLYFCPTKNNWIIETEFFIGEIDGEFSNKIIIFSTHIIRNRKYGYVCFLSGGLRSAAALFSL